MQKDNSIPSAGTNADSEQKVENTFASSHDTKPNVVGLPSLSHHKAILNKELWHKTETDLGEVSDFCINQKGNLVEVSYRSNGNERKIYTADKNMKLFLQCFRYCSNDFVSY